MPFMFSYFLLRGKVLCFACIGETCVTITAGDLVEKLYLRFYLTQIVHSNGKMLFLLLNNCLSKFLWRAAHIKFLYFKEKFWCFSSHVGKSVTCLKCSVGETCETITAGDLVEKIVSTVMLDTNRSFKR